MQNSERSAEEHRFGPFYRPDSRILILGSFPSVKSREQEFYYAHPQNRFWKVLAAIYSLPVPLDLAEKKELLTTCKIALWDVIESCEITGSSDASIKNARPTDLGLILRSAPVGRIILNGRTAEQYFLKLHSGCTAPYVCLPSTSPANASWSLERLIACWREGLRGEQK